VLHELPEQIVYKRMETAMVEAGLSEEIYWLGRLAILKRLPERERSE